MNSAHISYDWLRRARRLTYSVIGIFAALGLALTWRAALSGRVAEALAGAVVTLCVLGTGVVWSISIRLSMNVLRLRRRLFRLERRGGLGVSDGAVGLDRRVAALESVLRHSGGDAVSLDETHWADDAEPPGQRTMAAYEHLIGRGGLSDSLAGVKLSGEGQDDKQAMRLEFAALIHRHDYVGALATGDELVNRHPDSKAALDFRRVRPHLVRKIQLRETAGRGRGG
ncbi:MAG: hypothetical protein ACE5GE_14260 [Phycisphaerae bacterium]